MHNVIPLTVGPILGETTSTHTRIFSRAKKPAKGLKSHVVVELIDGVSSRVKITKASQDFDFTSITVFENLSPETEYKYRAGYFHDSADSNEIPNEHNIFNWQGIDYIKFKTGSNDANLNRTIAFGSCRYTFPNRTWMDSRGDKTFKNILAQHEESSLDGFFMLGDQIYADIFGKGISQLKSFYKLYRRAFSTPYIKQLMSQVPTFMTLDDHEIEDNWPEAKHGVKDKEKEVAAKMAYASYQVSHSPLFPFNNGKLIGTPKKFWYEYQDGCYELFMTDTRFERDSEKNEIISEKQMSALVDFLLRPSGKVKLVCSSVPFVGNNSDDKWFGFQKQRNYIIEKIRVNNIKKVVFLSGDVHFSSAFTLTSPDNPDFKITQLIASPFFWPVFDMSSGDVDEFECYEYKYVVTQIMEEFNEENYGVVDILPDQLLFKIYPRKGRVPLNQPLLVSFN